jgi:hypothetical protein
MNPRNTPSTNSDSARQAVDRGPSRFHQNAVIGFHAQWLWCPLPGGVISTLPLLIGGSLGFATRFGKRGERLRSPPPRWRLPKTPRTSYRLCMSDCLWRTLQGTLSHHTPRCSRPCARAERFSRLAATEYQSGRYQRAGMVMVRLKWWM